MELRTCCFSLVIEKNDKLNNKVISYDDLISYCNFQELIRFYALILHDKDKKIEDSKEVSIRPHYHLVIYLHNPFSKKTVINDIANYLKCNKNIISARVGDLVESTCYLTHDENMKGKYCYSSIDIRTNDINNLNSILSKQISSYTLTIDYLQHLVNSCNSLTEVYSVLGLKDSKLYRSLIHDMWFDLKDRI